MFAYSFVLHTSPLRLGDGYLRAARVCAQVLKGVCTLYSMCTACLYNMCTACLQHVYRVSVQHVYSVCTACVQRVCTESVSQVCTMCVQLVRGFLVWGRGSLQGHQYGNSVFGMDGDQTPRPLINEEKGLSSRPKQRHQFLVSIRII